MTECWCSNKYQIWSVHCVNNLVWFGSNVVSPLEKTVRMFFLSRYDLLPFVHETWHQCDCHIINQFVNISFSCAHLIFICSLCFCLFFSSFAYFLRFFFQLCLKSVCMRCYLWKPGACAHMQNIIIRSDFVELMSNVCEMTAREKKVVKRDKRLKTMKSKWNLNEKHSQRMMIQINKSLFILNEPFALCCCWFGCFVCFEIYDDHY